MEARPHQEPQPSMLLTAYATSVILMGNMWSVGLHPTFRAEFKALPVSVHDKLLSYAELIERFGPTLGRPWADSLNGSRHRNMKELRFSAGGGTWRVAFAFDPNRRAILLAIGDKSKVEGERFYRSLIAQADQRFDAYLSNMGGKEV